MTSKPFLIEKEQYVIYAANIVAFTAQLEKLDLYAKFSPFM